MWHLILSASSCSMEDDDNCQWMMCKLLGIEVPSRLEEEDLEALEAAAQEAAAAAQEAQEAAPEAAAAAGPEAAPVAAAAAGLSTQDALELLFHTLQALPDPDVVAGMCKLFPATKYISAVQFSSLIQQTFGADNGREYAASALCLNLPAAQQLGAAAVEGLVSAAIELGDGGAACMLCRDLPSADSLDGSARGRLLQAAGAGELWWAVRSLATLRAAPDTHRAAVFGTLQAALRSYQFTHAIESMCRFPQAGRCDASTAEELIFHEIMLGDDGQAGILCQSFPAAAQLPAAAVTRLLGTAVQQKRSEAVVALCTLPAAAILDPNDVMELWGATKATWGVWGDPGYLGDRKDDWMDWGFEAGVGELRELAEKQQKMDRDVGWAIMTALWEEEQGGGAEGDGNYESSYEEAE